MTLEPLLHASAAIQLHVVTAVLAVLLSVLQLALPRGGVAHRHTGRIWVLLMATVALSSFFIHEIRLVGPWSPIHVLSLVTLCTLVLGVLAIRRGQRRLHQHCMLSLIAFALIGAGAFTLLPGRLMHAILFGH